jgi:hypothetical protein
MPQQLNNIVILMLSLVLILIQVTEASKAAKEVALIAQLSAGLFCRTGGRKVCRNWMVSACELLKL